MPLGLNRWLSTPESTVLSGVSLRRASTDPPVSLLVMANSLCLNTATATSWPTNCPPTVKREPTSMKSRPRRPPLWASKSGQMATSTTLTTTKTKSCASIRSTVRWFPTLLNPTTTAMTSEMLATKTTTTMTCWTATTFASKERSNGSQPAKMTTMVTVAMTPLKTPMMTTMVSTTSPTFVRPARSHGPQVDKQITTVMDALMPMKTWTMTTTEFAMAPNLMTGGPAPFRR